GDQSSESTVVVWLASGAESAGSKFRCLVCGAGVSQGVEGRSRRVEGGGSGVVDSLSGSLDLIRCSQSKRFVILSEAMRVRRDRVHSLPRQHVPDFPFPESFRL